MAAVTCDEQLAAFAVSVKGELTSAPFPGLLTVTVAEAETEKLAKTKDARKIWLRRFIKSPEFLLGGPVAVKRPRAGFTSDLASLQSAVGGGAS
jgi:hypothetical protein